MVSTSVQPQRGKSTQPPPEQMFVQVPGAHWNVQPPPAHEFTHVAPARHSVSQSAPPHEVVKMEPDWPTKVQSPPGQS